MKKFFYAVGILTSGLFMAQCGQEDDPDSGVAPAFDADAVPQVRVSSAAQLPTCRSNSLQYAYVTNKGQYYQCQGNEWVAVDITDTAGEP